MDLSGTSRRRGLLALGAAAGLFAGAAPGLGQSSGGGSPLWFDPTQLPSFTGVVDRYLMDPDGGVTRLLFREGPQVLFPAEVGTALRNAIRPGDGIVAWGIRARRAPAIVMLAWARSSDAPPNFVDRPIWGYGDFEVTGEVMQVEGTIVAPLYNPQGEAVGAILPEGVVIRVPRSAGLALGDRLNAGRRIAASGRGREGPLGRSIDAERIGDAPDSLQPLPFSTEQRP